VKLPEALLIIPLSFLVGVVFASIGMCFTAAAPNIDAFNYPTFLFITPMFLFSGTFFPISILPKTLRDLSFVALPLTHAVHISRSLTLGRMGADYLPSLIWLFTVGTTLTILSINLMKRRLIT
jgi:lipooligosaccharide transport system permease protein